MEIVDFHKKEKELILRFDELKPLLKGWGESILEKFCTLIEEKKFPESSIQITSSRLKTNDSLIKKAFYRKLASSDPLKRIEDKIGIRIVVTNQKNARKLLEIISTHNDFWSSRVSRSPDKFLNNPKEFDYQSIHINLTPTKNVKLFTGISKKKLEYYICELQIRTLLQHAFAEVAHDTIYKGPYSYEGKIVRLLSRSMALMEVTDEHFNKAYDLIKEDKIYESSLMKRIINFSNEKLGDGKPMFIEKDMDSFLTSDILFNLDAKRINVEEIEKVVVQRKETIKSALENITFSLKRQPIIIFLFYLVYADEYALREKWHLDEDILKELFYRLGISYKK